MQCPVCSSENLKKIYSGLDKTVSRFMKDVPLRLSLFSCHACGIYFLEQGGYDLVSAHEAYWRAISYNMGEDYSVDDAPNQRALLKGLAGCNKAGKLLEIGCGNGSLLHLVRQSGWEVTGIELSSQAADYARKKFGLHIFTGACEDICGKLEGASFDAVIMWGLLEHLDGPLAALRTARTLLTKGGLLVIYTPNANSIFHKIARGIYRLTAQNIRFPMECMIIATHPFYFTSSALRRALGLSGFRVRSIELADINLDFVFRAHHDLWWANRLFLGFAKLIQYFSRILAMHSHMLVFAETV